MIDDSFYFGVEEDEPGDDGPDKFPMTYPFSATVPEMGLALLKVRQVRSCCLHGPVALFFS